MILFYNTALANGSLSELAGHCCLQRTGCLHFQVPRQVQETPHQTQFSERTKHGDCEAAHGSTGTAYRAEFKWIPKTCSRRLLELCQVDFPRDAPPRPAVTAAKRGRCSLCLGSDQKHSSHCEKCGLFFCSIHGTVTKTEICVDCSTGTSDESDED